MSDSASTSGKFKFSAIEAIKTDTSKVKIDVKDVDRTMTFEEYVEEAEMARQNNIELSNRIEELEDAFRELIFHFQDYGMEEESFACLMAVNKAEQVLKKDKN